MGRQAGGQTGRWADRQVGRQAGGLTDRWADRQAGRQAGNNQTFVTTQLFPLDLLI